MDAKPLSNPDNKIAVPAKPARRKRRWWQFSLRTLMLFVLVVAGANCWLSAVWHRKLEQRRVVEALREAGADVGYDYEVDATGSQLIPRPAPPGPAWIHSMFGDDVFSQPTYVGIVDSKKEHEALAKIGDLNSLTRVYLHLMQSSSRPFEAIKELPNLEILEISGPVDGHDIVGIAPLPCVTDLALLAYQLDDFMIDDLTCQHIKRTFPSLKTLVLDSRLMDRGIESLSGMQMLESLTVSVAVPDGTVTRFTLHDCPRLKSIKATYSEWGAACAVLDLANLPALETLELTGKSIRLRNLPKLKNLAAGWNGLEHIEMKGMDNLEEIDFFGNSFPVEEFAQLEGCSRLVRLNLAVGERKNIDGALGHIARIPSLKALDLSCTSPSESGLARLQSLPHLDDLDLSLNDISDSSLNILMKLKSLRRLHLTGVTPDQVKRLQSAIPGLECKVD